MKFTVNRSALVTALARVTPLTKQKTTMPILSCVLIRAELLKGLTLSGSNLQQSVTTRALADVADAGAICVDARDIEQRIKTFPEGPIAATLDGAHLQLTAGKRKHRVPVVPAEEYPPLAPPPAAGITVAGETLIAALSTVQAAASQDADRPTLHGALLQFLDGAIAAAATDGRCVYHVTLPAPTVKPARAVILPLGSVEAIIASTESDALATIGMGELEFGVVSGNTALTTKLVSGDFPPVAEFLSRMPQESFSVDAAELADAISAASMGTKDGDLRGIVELSLEGDELTLAGEGKGMSSAAVTVTPHNGAKPPTVLVSGALMQPFLRAVKGVVAVHLDSGDLDPIYPTSGTAKAIVMPCRK